MDFEVLSDEGDVVRLKLLGRVIKNEVTPSADSMCDVLGPDAFARRVLLSLEEVHFIDSEGLTWLILCHKRFVREGGKFVLHSVGPDVFQLLKLMRLDLSLNLADDEAAALVEVGEA